MGSNISDPDVVVVGSGASGGIVSYVLARKGLKVVTFESGPSYEPHEYPSAKESSKYWGWYTEKYDSRKELVTYDDASDLKYISRLKAVGGSTLNYGMISHRFYPQDFRMKSTWGVGEDWPLTYEELAPYYTRVEYLLGVAGETDTNPFLPPRELYPNPPHPLTYTSEVIAKVCKDQLGLHPFVPPLASLSKPQDDRPACQKTGNCLFGCLIQAKSSTDVVCFKKIKRLSNFELRSESTVSEIKVNKNRVIEGVVYFDSKDREQFQKARAVVLCCNSIETPRLLLLSSSLPNRSGLVGRNLMVHTGCMFTVALDVYRPLGYSYEKSIPANLSIHDFCFPEDKVSNGRFEISIGPLMGSEVEKDAIINYLRKKGLSSGEITYKRLLKTLIKKYEGLMVTLDTMGEQLPHPLNCVTLDNTTKDYWGLPVAKVNLKYNRGAFDSVEEMENILETISKSCNGVILDRLSPSQLDWGRSHYMGTCCMGTNPDTSVVNPYGQTHEVENLFIADGSVFVTGSCLNPTLTIQAMAWRCAEHIINQFGNRK